MRVNIKSINPANLETLHIKTTKTARCQVLLPKKADTKFKECWIVIHGYAQLASDFLKSFESLSLPGRLIAAPEGLNRFYAKGFNGSPAATWMTSEDRENEIEDYCNYLQKVYELLKHQYSLSSDCKFVLLGFSQGVATLSRWVNKIEPEFDQLVFYAGSIAHDLNWGKFTKQVKNKLHIVSGDKDPFITKEKLDEVLREYQENGLEFKTHFFSGGHVIEPQVLEFLNS